MQFYRHISLFGVVVLSICLLALSFSVSAKEFGVAEREFVAGNMDKFASSKVFNFNVSGGEVIGSSTPIRAYITVEGVYEGQGTVRALLDGDTESAEIFALPDAGATGVLQFVLGDKTGVLKTNEAGTFAHTLTLEPSGVTLSGVSIHVSTMYAREVGNKCPEGLPSSEKEKTVQFWVGNEKDISGSITQAIVYGLNDDLEGVQNPIASAYVEVIGLYTGGGTVEMHFNNRASDGVSYELKAAAHPKQFILLSKDIKDIIGQESGMSYSQNFTIETSGVSLKNVSMRFVLTYRYHPLKSSCGGYPPTGEYVAPPLDTGATGGVLYNSITWRGELGGEFKNIGRVRFQLATAACANGASNPPDCNLGSWSFLGGATCSATDWFESAGPGAPVDLFRMGCSPLLDGKQFYRYKVQLCAKDCIEMAPTTPMVDEIFVSWSP